MKERLVTPTVEWSMRLPTQARTAKKAQKGADTPPTPPASPEAVLKAVLEAFWHVAQITQNGQGSMDGVLAFRPKIVRRGPKRYLSIRWGGRYLAARHRQKLEKRDPRFHACPPLRKGDDGMVACKED